MYRLGYPLYNYIKGVVMNIKDYYDIREDGTVFSNRSNKVIKAFEIGRGYLKVALRTQDNQTKGYLVHRLVATKYIPNPDNKEQVNHIDGNKLNNNVSNLEWTTNQENRTHAIKNGLIPKTEFEKGSSVGSLNQAAKLNERLVLELRDKGLSFSEFCKQGFNNTLKITKACYNQMMRRYTWKHI